MQSFKFKWHPSATGILSAIFLFLLYIPKWLVFLSPMHGSFAFDYFTLPRCGLAMRNGTDLFTSSADYHFGYFATNWASHPALCAILGVPTSFLNPWLGFWLVNVLYLFFHIFILYIMGKRIKPINNTYSIYHHISMFALGMFFPWYMNYHLGQYHLVFVLALALVLSGFTIAGFSISALGKPALAPASLCLLAAKKWKSIIIIAVICCIGYLPFLNPRYANFFNISSLYSHYSVRGWDQEMGWVKVFDELMAFDHYFIRIGITVLLTLYGAWVARKNLSLGIAITSLWFFFSYGRIHEYHYATFVPLLAWALGEEKISPKHVMLAAIALALPTIWPLLTNSSAFISSKKLDFSLARVNHPALFWIWLLHRPMAVLGVTTIFLKASK